MSKETGEKGEKIALKYLKKQGYKILEKNYRALRGEIDIIAVDKNTLVFIEIKTNNLRGAVPPEMRVNAAKQRQIGKIARAYLQQTGRTECDCRFDVIGVIIGGKGESDISHYKDAFWLPGDV